jgi:hypothetical protein
MLSWARAAGFTDIVASATTWLFATPEDRAWWGGMWADRVVQSDFAGQAVELGEATTRDLVRVSDAWSAWAADDDDWLALLHGEIRCRV